MTNFHKTYKQIKQSKGTPRAIGARIAEVNKAIESLRKRKEELEDLRLRREYAEN